MNEHRLVTTRRARYYTIGGDGGGPHLDEVWIVLHGQGQRASVFLKYFESIAAPGRLIVAPEALNRHYIAPGTSGRAADAEVGTTWMTRMDRENEIADYVDFLDAVWHEVAGQAPHVAVLGFSQGVATACRWIAMGKSPVHRLIAWAGQLPPDVDPSVFAKLPGGVTLVTGTEDEYASWIAEGNSEGRLVAAGVNPNMMTFDGGHRMDRLTLRQLAEPSRLGPETSNVR